MNNTIFYKKNDGLYVYKETGKFFTEISNLGNDVRLFQISEEMADTNTFANYNLCGRGLIITDIKRGNSRLWAFIKAFCYGIREVFKSDVVYVFYPGPICAFIAFVALIFNKEFGLYIRGEQGIANWFSRLLYRHAKVVFTISPQFSEKIAQYGGRTFTIRPMIGFNESEIDFTRSYVRQTEYKLLYVGRIVHDKGVFEMVKGLSLLKQSGFHWTIDIIGNGPDLEELKKEADFLGIGNLVRFRGIVSSKEELKGYYKNADLFIMPSHHEGFPRVLYEAMIFGVPIITTFVGTIGALMVKNVSCYEIPVNDYQALASQVENVLQNYPEQAQVAVTARNIFAEYMSDKKDSHAVQLHKVLHNI